MVFATSMPTALSTERCRPGWALKSGNTMTRMILWQPTGVELYDTAIIASEAE